MKRLLFVCIGGLMLSGPVFAHSGKAIYDQTCFACHGSGLLNAPKFGDKEAWAPRIAQGKKTLYEHVNYGFNSMPPHGGNDELTEKDLEATVDYMVQQAGGDNVAKK